MRNLQADWRQSSAQIAEAKGETKSYREELEELRERQSEIERELSDLEITIQETQKARASHLRQGIRETASVFSERSASYVSLHSGDLFSAKSIEDDKATISTYESAKVEKIKSLLQAEYEQALKNQAERQKAKFIEPIDAGVVLHKKGEQKLDLYLTAFAGPTGGLADNLTQTVRDIVQASGVSFAENNVEDLLRMTVEGDYQGLVQALEKIKPEGFKEAQVEYQVVVLGEAVLKTTDKREKRARTALQLEEAIPVDKITDGYISVDAALEGYNISRQNLFKYVESKEIESQKVKLTTSTVSGHKVRRIISIRSLEEFVQSRGRTLSTEVRSGDALQSSAVYEAEPLSGQETTVAVPAAETVKEPVLENMVSVSPNAAIEVTSEPQPNQSQAQLILGEEIFAKYLATYDAKKIEEIVGIVSGLGEERAKILFQADRKGSLFREQSLPRYIGRANLVLSEVDKKYGSDTPSEFSFEERPTAFFPTTLSAMEKRIEAISIRPKPLPVPELLAEMKISPVIARKLTDEGYDPICVYAMLTEGFDLSKSHPLIGERYTTRRNWQHNYRRAFDSLRVKVSERAISYHERKFNSLGLLYVKYKEERPLAFNPDWAKKTFGALRDYLSCVFPRR